MEIAVKERRIAREKMPRDGFLLLCECVYNGFFLNIICSLSCI
jgi:hypothetical protein